MICEECKGEVVYDPIHDESLCSACGLVQDVNEPKIEFPLYSDDFKPVFLSIDSKKQDYNETTLQDEDDSEEIKKLRSIASDVEGDDWFVAATEHGNIIGGITSIPNEHGEKDYGLWNYSNPRKYYTHHRFIRTSFRRCKIGIQNLPIHCCNRMGSKYCERECKHAVDGLPIHCHSFKNRSEYEKCEGCKYAIETCLRDREQGIESLLCDLSYPKICYDTFFQIPYINPYMVASNREISDFLEQQVKKI